MSLTAGTATTTAAGKVWTIPVNGATGVLVLASGTVATGLTLHTSTGYTIPVVSSAFTGSDGTAAVVLTLATAFASTDTVQLDVATTSNVRDSAGTPNAFTANSNNNATTNTSTVAATVFNLVTNASSFEINGAFSGNFTWGGNPGIRFDLPESVIWSGMTTDFNFEFVTDASDGDLMGYLGGGASVSVDGAAATSVTGTGVTGFLPLFSGLTAGTKHLIRVNTGGQPYINGVRLTGASRAMYAVPTTKVTAASNTAFTSGNTPATSPVRLWGTGATPSTSGVVGAKYQGTIAEFQFSGSGIDAAMILGQQGSWAVSVDGGSEGSLVVIGSTDGVVDNLNGYATLVAGQSSGTHTVRAMQIGTASASNNLRGFRVVNGTKTTAAASIGDGTLTVAATTSLIAVNDWVKIDRYGTREYRRVTAISGSGPYTLTLHATLAKAHASGAEVTSYSAPAGTITAYQSQDLSAKRVVGMGDSNTHGAWRGTAASPLLTVSGVEYGWYDNRQSYLYKATQLLNYEFVNVGVQGTTTTNQLSRAADINTYSRSAFDYLLIRELTNDINGTSLTKATVKANVQGQIDVAVPNLRAGGKIWLIPAQTPAGVTNAGGLSTTTGNAALSEIAVDPTYSASTAYASGFYNGFNLTDWDATTNPTGDRLGNLHFSDSGIAKSANNTIPYLSATGFTTSGTNGTVTVTRAGGSTFANANGTADQITLTASGGTITATAVGGTITNNGTGTVTVKPVDGATSFTYTASTTATITYSNAQNWTNPAATSYTIPDTTAPTATLTSHPDVTTVGGASYDLTVTYADNVAIDVSTLGTGDVTVSGPNAFSDTPTFISVDTNTNGTPRVATYRFTAPGGSWNTPDNGTYTIAMAASQVRDTAANAVAAGTLGTFNVNVDSVAPALASATVSTSGATVDLAFTETASPPLLPATGITGFTLKVNTVTRSATIARSGTTHVVLTPATPIYKTDVVTVSYAPGNVTDSAATPNALAAFTNSAVTNSSQLNLPPTLDTAAPGDAQVTLGWTYPTVTDGEFDVYKSTDGINFSIALVLTDYTLRSKIVPGLTNGQAYYFRLVYQDAGFTSPSDPSNRLGPVTPTDTTAPVISGVTAGSPAATAATITWGTNEVADSQVEYGLTTGYGSSTTLDATPLTFHNVGLSGLTPGTLYHYRVKSRDAAGNLATGTDNTFTTAAAPDVTPPVISAVSAGTPGQASATISWTTDEAADAQVEYGTSGSYGSSSSLDASLVTSHGVGLSGLAAGTLYHYRVKSRDAAGNLATGTDHTFTTAAATGTEPTLDPTYCYFASLAEADAMAAALPGLAKYKAADPTAKAAALLAATIDVDAAGPWQGRKIDLLTPQVLAFPRVAYESSADCTRWGGGFAGVRNSLGEIVWDWDAASGAAVVPLKVKRATLFQADAILDSRLYRSLDDHFRGVSSKGVGSLNVSYRDPAAIAAAMAGALDGLCRQAAMQMKDYRLRQGRLL